jgi:hypothetical protein
MQSQIEGNFSKKIKQSHCGKKLEYEQNCYGISERLFDGFVPEKCHGGGGSGHSSGEAQK